ncbi:hypothetical protein KP79_PYT21753 [Mizuhopecten yessoensis]|uniref:Uncharacterized protein n=1 Tax=Mizuhopecten yessoensis TaxID=6573 RepID=A0A210PTK1_MIZYE|nr:hypothetical protein KP79_PYT21753 [Mizuhopecten yessoensis]
MFKSLELFRKDNSIRKAHTDDCALKGVYVYYWCYVYPTSCRSTGGVHGTALSLVLPRTVVVNRRCGENPLLPWQFWTDAIKQKRTKQDKKSRDELQDVDLLCCDVCLYS